MPANVSHEVIAIAISTPLVTALVSVAAFAWKGGARLKGLDSKVSHLCADVKLHREESKEAHSRLEKKQDKVNGRLNVLERHVDTIQAVSSLQHGENPEERED